MASAAEWVEAECRLRGRDGWRKTIRQGIYLQAGHQLIVPETARTLTAVQSFAGGPYEGALEREAFYRRNFSLGKHAVIYDHQRNQVSYIAWFYED